MSSFPPSQFFPPAESADYRGLIGVGGELSTEWLLDAYRHGIFPWPTRDELLAWWSPDPRAVIEFEALHVSHKLARTLRSNRFTTTCDRAFTAVMEGCASAQQRAEATWITPSIIAAYARLHQLGVAHSVEVWHDGELAGGVYGVGLGAMFAAESMFYRQSNASKVALVRLVRHLQARGYQLLDVQQLTPHTARLGAGEISRARFLERLAVALKAGTTFGRQLEGLG